ncbi:MAG: DUF5317 family protein [Actinomycetes bacterium]
MALLLSVTVGAILVGWATGGRLERLADVPMRGWRVVLVAIAAVVAGAMLSTIGGAAGYAAAVGGPLAAAVCVLTVLTRNRAVEGVPLLAAGLLLNAAVIAANGVMPVSLYAESRAGVPAGSLLRAEDSTHEIADSHTRLRAFSDVVPVPLPGRPEIVSVGDILIVSGVALLIVSGMHRRRASDETELADQRQRETAAA